MTQVLIDIGYVPNALNTQATITATDLGYENGNIPDGVYTFEFNVWGIPADSQCLLATTTIHTLLFRNTYTCINKWGVSILGSCDTCDDSEEVISWLMARLKMEQLVIASLTNIECVRGKIERILADCKKDCITC